jgi:hypothetical protein
MVIRRNVISPNYVAVSFLIALSLSQDVIHALKRLIGYELPTITSLQNKFVKTISSIVPASSIVMRGSAMSPHSC